MRSNYCTFCLAQLIHIVVYLLIVYELLRYFKQNLHDGGLLNSTGPLPVFHHTPLLCAKNEVQAQTSIKNPHDRHVHNSLSNVLIHMPCVNIHHAGHYQLKIVFLQLDACLSLIAMDNTLHGFDFI